MCSIQEMKTYFNVELTFVTVMKIDHICVEVIMKPNYQQFCSSELMTD